MSDNGERTRKEGSMVGLICDDGVILATSSRDNLIYLLEERIYCCAPRSGIERKKVLDVCVKVDYLTRESGQKMTVAQVRDLLCQKFEYDESVDILLGGQDDLGLHIYSLKANGGSRRVIYAAKGKKSDEAVAYLAEHWKESLTLDEAEQLARESLKLEVNDFVEICIINRAEQTEEAASDEDN
ncbi:uncharacterized protein LOC128255483 [Drosophila gunungcola]|uniref:Uncharacterized protein n=1 Tax=Drosophila gunungcola TaxID=103775 RepID=A0A9P9YID1_9MUSC|nr:uncharacterized protein LOC128255483 [Drosophila gunungcola]XP_052841079.1 uncharacterized protein LOC128255483 [Drosophila gunungcola]XP_052841080.1 uncharacterized protein LOC128255483 [Drosophila gunungcola]XP_052841081.1 uncharacterized protein LOC128255483 [Drosophila gunungcola]KAI8037503.1 hypothetical protein M5D96_009655 [Drosophila gunungcola]